jgi:hypothetical protein
MRPVPMLLAMAAAFPSAARTQPAPIPQVDWFPGSSSIEEPEIIPAGFRGHWAPDAAACRDPDGVDRLTVVAHGVDTYESGGRLERITQSGQERAVRLKLAYEGEGNFWDVIEVWALSGDGRRLTMQREGEPGSSVTLIRCD